MSIDFCCVGCRRCYRSSKPAPVCPVCKPHRIEAKQRFAVCTSNRCGHYGTDERGRTGCLLLPLIDPDVPPCDVFGRILAGGGCVSPRPLFGPVVVL